ncbi:MAG: GumC family protein, partial [Thermodesulfobacteriota bacterium]
TVPENYIRSTITDSVVGRLSTISQEILSRTRLEKVIHEFNLYADIRNSAPMEAVVDTMRKAIEVKVENQSQSERAQNSFSISYEGREPRTVMMVTNKLASLFIEENLRVRELQAERTSEFLSKELDAMKEKLKTKDEEIRNIKQRYMGELPQQLDANLRVLERLQQQLHATNESIRAVEDRVLFVQNRIEQLNERGRVPTSRKDRVSQMEDRGGEQAPEDPVITRWGTLNRELKEIQSKYTETHPDVIDLKTKIAKLEPRVMELLEKEKVQREARLNKLKSRRETDTVEELPLALDPVAKSLLDQYDGQLHEGQLEAKRLRAEENNLREQIAIYQKRIEDTPKREQEFALLMRDYDLMKLSYQSLLDKKIQAGMAENLERKQQGEQFRVLDLASVPENPVKPNRDKILLWGTMLGLVVGLGLAWFRDSLDPSLHSVAAAEVVLGIPVIAAIPNLQENKTRKLLKESRSREKDEIISKDLTPRALPDSIIAGQFGMLKTEFFLQPFNPPHSILVTSTYPGEGKSVVSLNLAAAISKEFHKKTILIDANMRNPSIHVAGHQHRKGLSDYLTDQTAPQEILIPQDDHLWVIPAGSSSRSLESVGSKKMADLLMALREFVGDSHIVIDGPPILSTLEAILLSKMVDGVVLVIRADRTPKELIRRAISSIDRQKVIGVVLNQKQVKKLGAYSSYY